MTFSFVAFENKKKYFGAKKAFVDYYFYTLLFINTEII